MPAYQKERLEKAMFFFAQDHYKKIRKYLSQTALYKYLAFFEFRYLEKTGNMPLELTYKAMEHGPVPMEVYENREEKGAFSTVIFEPTDFKAGNSGYLVKPNGKFNADYFADAELEEMRNLIEMFAQGWVGAAVMSDASHKSIPAWKKTYAKSPNAIIDPIEEFNRDITTVPEDSLSTAEERFLIHRKIAELAN
jgi:uncharacterized phage-associated protein